jgi:DNA-3-methyladenine glycosylase II
MNVENLRSLRAAAHRLAERCQVIARAVAIGGTPPWRCDEVGYPGLARTIVYQQLSGRAAATIWSRVQALLPVVSPSAVLAASSDDLRGCGLSRGKVEHLRSVAEAVASGALNFARVASADDEEARAELTAVRGVGPWTADVYLMFSLRRPDVFPHGDLGLAEAYRLLADLAERPSPRELLEFAETWRPARAVAAHLLWSALNVSKSAAKRQG